MFYSKCNFRVEERFVVQTPVYGHEYIGRDYALLQNGKLVVEDTYTWDGATGAVDSDSMIKASCVHDILCELINAGIIPKSYQKVADQLLIDKMKCYWKWLRVNGTKWQKFKEFVLRFFIWLRQKWVYRVVRIYQENKTTQPRKQIYEVP